MVDPMLWGYERVGDYSGVRCVYERVYGRAAAHPLAPANPALFLLITEFKFAFQSI